MGDTKRMLRWSESEVLMSLRDRSGMGGEQFRKLSNKLEALKETLGGAMQVIVVTSPLMGEGKTVIAGNLAATLAREEGKRVILVDCDARKPRVWELFGSAPETGLADVLLQGTRPEDATHRTEEVDLDVLALPRYPDGRIDPLPIEKMKSLFRDLRARYDFVVCDAPPVLPIADAAALGRLSDGIVLVIRAGLTPRQAVARTLDAVDRRKLIGFILNAVPERVMDRYYYRYYADGKDGSGSRKSSSQ